MSIAAGVLLSALALCGYVYIGYPLILAGAGHVRRREVHKQEITPSVSVIIPAYNEQYGIAEKIDNTLLLKYPRGRLEILVVSDGSTDATEDIVRTHAQGGVQLLALARCGKAYALNHAAAQATGDILVFSDANAMLDAQALRALIRNFHDPEVGGVCGNQRYRMENGTDAASEGENLYWSYDKWVKKLESRLGSTVAADGSLYAIRKELFVPIADPAQADDFAISARVVTQGYRLVYEPEAVAYEDPPTSAESEFWRKVRVTNHCLRASLYLIPALKPRCHGEYIFKLLSHKVLRYAVPFLLMIAFGNTIALMPESELYAVIFFCQVAFYSIAMIGYWLRRTTWAHLKLFCAPFYFCLANGAVFLGVLSVARGNRITAWQPQRYR